jgi:predicted DNA-binding transcriptional regulator AlpA
LYHLIRLSTNGVTKMNKLLRVRDIVRDKKSGTFGYLPISKSAWWQGVAEGKYPQPIKLGPKTTCWRESDILALINKC